MRTTRFGCGDTAAVNLLQPRRLRQDIAAVVFSCDESDLSRFAIESGPCVSSRSGLNPLASPLTQDLGETPALTSSLYTALTGHSDVQALPLVDRVGRGRLSQCSEHFVEAMATYLDESLRLADEDDAKGDKALSSFAQHQDALSEAWRSVGRWPREVVGLQNRLVRLGTAREALAQGRPVFAWHGPAVPQFVVMAGQGPYSPPS